jgi:hypothetical protein
MDPTPENLRARCCPFCQRPENRKTVCAKCDPIIAAADRIDALEQLVRAMWDELPDESEYVDPDRHTWRMRLTRWWDPDALELARVLGGTE